MNDSTSVKRPSERIWVCSEGDSAPEGYKLCALGRHLALSPSALGSFLHQEIPARAEDLLVLAGAVAFVDRSVTRHHATCWERNLHLNLPVRDFDFWQQECARAEVEGLLAAVTGDSWMVEFRPGRIAFPVSPQSSFALASAPPVVIPYSNGLDSFAVARLHTQPSQQVIRVSTGRIGDTEKKARKSNSSMTRWVAMPISLPNAGRQLREQSYRSRGFLFGAVAATAAGLMEASEILVPESGQGSFGPALTMVGQEHPDVRTSPIFTSALGRFVTRLFEREIRFVHPRIWSTKGETLEALRLAGKSDGWKRTTSCSRSSRQKREEVSHAHCGVCSNCLLRRQALLAGGLGEPEEGYAWPDLAADPPWMMGGGIAPGRSEVQQAISATLAMRDFALLDARSPAALRDASAMAAALGESKDSAAAGVKHVIEKHRQEWVALLDTLHPNSLFNALGGLS